MVCNLKNGSCSKCGGCCSNILPLTDNEKNKIKKIIKKRKLKPSYHIPLNGFDMTCPMLDSNSRCRIYEDRPNICRVYRCDKSVEQGAVEFYRSLTAKAKPVVMRDLFNE